VGSELPSAALEWSHLLAGKLKLGSSSKPLELEMLARISKKKPFLKLADTSELEGSSQKYVKSIFIS